MFAAIRRYRAGHSLDIRLKGADVIVAISAEREDFEPDDDGRGWLSSLLPLRVAVTSGDERLPYFGWLLGVQSGEMRDNTREPARPAEPGLLDASARDGHRYHGARRQSCCCRG